jgi:hypothetical protein
MRFVTMRFVLLVLAVGGCGFTDKPRQVPADLGALDGRTATDGAVPPDMSTDGAPAGWVCNSDWYFDVDCDCGCGIPDPACSGNGCSAVGCCVPASCAVLGCFYCGANGDPCDFPEDGGVDVGPLDLASD